MKSHFQLLVTLLMLSIFILTACAPKPVVTPTGALPNSLITIEAAAEDIIDFAPSGNWDKISSDVADIANAWKAYQPQASKGGASQENQDAMTSALAKLQTASESKNPVATM